MTDKERETVGKMLRAAVGMGYWGRYLGRQLSDLKDVVESEFLTPAVSVQKTDK